MPSQREVLTKLAVVLEWGWQVANEKPENPSHVAYVDTPIGKGIKIVKDMVEPLVHKDKVVAEFEKIKNDPDKIEAYLKRFQFEIKDKLHEAPKK